uniref:Protein kinase domain-containing protein n=1 Tax=Elaeophora elaphi TaxID=1147741 RepID=A0A0R3RMA2_9BILA
MSEADIASSSTTNSVSKATNGTFGYNDFAYCDDPEGAQIDEECMPEELRGKKWKTRKLLGEGGNFRVYLVTTSEGLEYAMRWCLKQDRGTKKYTENQGKSAMSMMQLHLESAVQLKKLIGDHPNIVRLIGFRKVNFSTQQIMEYVDGGDLHDYISNNYITSMN